METISAIVLAVAIAVERLVEVVKPLYLRVKNTILKREYRECTKTEKIIMTVLIGPVLCIIGGIGLDIAGIPVAASQILCGLVASIGSNVIHTILNLIIAFKDAAEGLKPKEIKKIY